MAISGFTRLRCWLAEPVDAASSAAFRITLGALLLASTVRFAWKGWIDEFAAFVERVYMALPRPV